MPAPGLSGLHPVAYHQDVLDLVLLRHGQSTWNAENLFTGWVDVDLTEVGEAEARDGGRLLAEEPDLDLRILHTSVLTRAIRTAELALAAAGRSWLPVRRDWRLNERHYGDLQGKNKSRDHGRVREGAAAAVAPELRHPAAAAARRTTPWSSAGDPRYRDLARRRSRPPSAWPTWSGGSSPTGSRPSCPTCARRPRRGGAVLVAAHGNSIRALRKHLEGISRRRHRRARDPDRHPLPAAPGRRPHGAVVAATWATRRRRQLQPRPWAAKPASTPAVAPRRGRAGH